MKKWMGSWDFGRKTFCWKLIDKKFFFVQRVLTHLYCLSHEWMEDINNWTRDFVQSNSTIPINSYAQKHIFNSTNEQKKLLIAYRVIFLFYILLSQLERRTQDVMFIMKNLSLNGNYRWLCLSLVSFE